MEVTVRACVRFKPLSWCGYNTHCIVYTRSPSSVHTSQTNVKKKLPLPPSPPPAPHHSTPLRTTPHHSIPRTPHAVLWRAPDPFHNGITKPEKNKIKTRPGAERAHNSHDTTVERARSARRRYLCPALSRYPYRGPRAYIIVSRRSDDPAKPVPRVMTWPGHDARQQNTAGAADAGRPRSSVRAAVAPGVAHVRRELATEHGGAGDHCAARRCAGRGGAQMLRPGRDPCRQQVPGRERHEHRSLAPGVHRQRPGRRRRRAEEFADRVRPLQVSDIILCIIWYGMVWYAYIYIYYVSLRMKMIRVLFSIKSNLKFDKFGRIKKMSKKIKSFLSRT